MDVSIILVNYNTKDLTLECIKSVYEKTNGIDFDIYVVDNNSWDGSCEAIEQAYPQVKLIKNKENQGFGAANNIAVKLSDAKYCFCLNTDTILINNAVKILYDFMENNPQTGVCGGQLYDKDMKIAASVGNFPSTIRIFFQFCGLKYIFHSYWEKKIAPAKSMVADRPVSVDYISGADIFFRKSVLDKIGLFDENIFMYGEESDICFRIKKAGFDVIFVPDSKIIHLCGKSSANLNKQKIISESLLYWYRKNIGTLPFILLKSVLMVTFFIKFIFTQNNNYKELLQHISRL